MVVTPAAAVIWIALGAALAAAAVVRGRQRALGVGVGIAAFVAVLCVCGALYTLPTSVLLGPIYDLLGAIDPDLAFMFADFTGGPDIGTTIGFTLALVVLAAVVGVWARYQVNRVLTEELAGGRHMLPAVPGGRIGQRIRTVSSAQWGNLVVHSHPDPFLGAGITVREWSMCLPLASASVPGTRVELDAVAMHTAVRAKLEAMRKSPLRDREKISGLVSRDHVVASGARRHNDSLIDPAERRPYCEASPEAIEAIIRHPQGSLRYYQRTIVGTEGKNTIVEPNLLVVPAQDQEIVVSTFLYLAVEGGMLYAEFVAKVLPPIDDEFHALDHIAPGRILGRSVGEALPRLPLDFVAAPFRLIRGISGGGHASRMIRADRLNREAHVYEYGCRINVRQLASTSIRVTHLQRLDAEKYYKLVERCVTGAILDYLEDRDIDTAEYRERVSQVHNYGIMISGGTVTGPTAAGTNATAASV